LNHSGSSKTTEKVIRLTFFVTTNFSLYHARYDFCNAIFSHFFLFAILRLCVKLILIGLNLPNQSNRDEGDERDKALKSQALVFEISPVSPSSL